MGMQLKMEQVEHLPLIRARRGYADQAKTIRANLVLAGQPMLVAESTSRNSLESLARHLKDEGDVTTVISMKGEDGDKPVFGLYAEYTPAAA